MSFGSASYVRRFFSSESTAGHSAVATYLLGGPKHNIKKWRQQQTWWAGRRQFKAATCQVQRYVSLCCAVSFCLFYGVVLDILIENVLINFAFIIIHGSPVDMLHSLFPHYSFPFISYGYFFQITLLNTCKFHSIWIAPNLVHFFSFIFFHPATLTYLCGHCRYSRARDENYTTYYPPRDLAAYIPAYLALLFVFVPILYMGLNMLSCPAVDSIDNIWDTQSTCNSMNKDVVSRCSPVMGKGVNYSVPTICDEDVRSVNLRLRQNIMSSGNKRVDDR